MKRKSKVFISLVLSVIILLACMAPLGAAAAEYENDLPIVYIKGAGREIYSADGTCIMPFAVEPEDQIMAELDTLLTAFGNSLLANDWSIYCNKLISIIRRIYKDVTLDNNGEASDGSYIIPSGKPVRKTSNFYLSNYIFNYDSRLDPWEVAEDLDAYINAVLEATGKDKVSLVGRCLGGNYAAAYLTRYGGEKVDTCVMYVSSTLGTVVCSESFSGSFVFDPDLINDYVNSGDFASDELGSLIQSVVSITHYVSALSLGTDAVESIYRQIANELVPELLLSSYATMPAYWSMVDDDNFEKAKNFIFGDEASQYEGLIEKIDNYHYNVMNCFDQTARKLQQQGVKFAVISKYNIPLPPVFQSSRKQADGTIELSNLSFGATSANYGDHLDKEYLDYVADCGALEYVSDDLIVDASTCLFPDSTWFIKNSEHTDFAACINNLIYEILRSKDQMTVWDNESYPQYLEYNSNNTLTPVKPATPDGNTGNEQSNFLEVLVSIFKRMVTFIKSIFGILN